MQIEAGQVLRQQHVVAMTRELRRAIDLLSFNNAGLRAYLEREARTNPLIELRPLTGRPFAPDDTPPPAPVPTGGGQGWGSGADPAGPDALPAAPPGLLDHVLSQIRMAACDARQVSIAHAFLDVLEPYGWLQRDIADIAEAAECTCDEAEAVLTLLQACDPPGIFARSLEECLRLQARDRGALDPLMERVLDRLDLVAEGDLPALAMACDATADAVAARVALLRSFDPKPGLAFDAPPPPLRSPDLIATEEADGWKLELNDATLPAIAVREDRVCDESVRDGFVAEALASARGLQRAIEYRNANTLAVAAEILKRQSRYCADRALHPEALSLREVADATGLHESTVSRLVAGLLIETPRGVLVLRDLFCRALAGQSGRPGVSVARVRARVAALIGAERPDAPLTDAMIVEALDREGVRIGRRTVAKYRAMAGLPGAAERRRRSCSSPKGTHA